MGSKIVCIFDFDKTIIDCDSDNWVVDELGATELFDQLFPTTPWNTLMDLMMKELHERGKSIKDIEEVLKRTPIRPRILAAIKSAHAKGCELRIVSDANMFFIETILKHFGLRDYFSEINTNPCVIDEEGRLRIFSYYDSKKSSHGCNLCPPNMCKGLIVKRIQASVSSKSNETIIYLGDGIGDYCPSLKLDKKDYVMPRKNFPMSNLINENPMLVTAKVHEWVDDYEFERILLHIISTVLIEENDEDMGGAKFVPGDLFKLQTTSIVSHEAVPPTITLAE